MSIKILPALKGYTVDLKLKEFRKSVPEVILEFISFDSPKGKILLEELKIYASEILLIDND